MKPILLLALTLAAFGAGCELESADELKPDPTDNTNTFRFRFHDDVGYHDEIHVVKVDGAEYVIAITDHGIAICPKTTEQTFITSNLVTHGVMPQ